MVKSLDGGGATVRPLLRDFSRQIGILVAPFLTLSTPRALETLRSARPTAPLARSRFAADFPSMARVFIEDCAKAEAQAGYLVDRGAGGDLDGHAIGVAAVTSRLAGLVGMDARERVRAVCAALVHDVGMIFVPRHVLAIPHAQHGLQMTRFVAVQLTRGLREACRFKVVTVHGGVLSGGRCQVTGVRW